MGKSADTDVTAMCLQALAPYKSDSTVKESIDRALNVLSKNKMKKGGLFFFRHSKFRECFPSYFCACCTRYRCAVGFKIY